jgi:homoserine O-acetyltransferase
MQSTRSLARNLGSPNRIWEGRPYSRRITTATSRTSPTSSSSSSPSPAQCQRRWQTTKSPARSLHQQTASKAQATAAAPRVQPLPADSSNPALSFPCLDAVESRTLNLHRRSQESGPEPSYTTGRHQVFRSQEPFLTDWGGVLPEFEIAFESWGSLNADRSNAILLHTGLSASSHAHSTVDNPKPGWWEKFIGPGKSLDTDKYFVVCTNVIGGCFGSTGPSSVDPANGERYATRFPILTMQDMVRAQFRLLDALKITKLYASVGASMGGMQSLAAGTLFPERVGKVVSISGCARSHPYSIAMRHTQRQGQLMSL